MPVQKHPEFDDWLDALSRPAQLRVVAGIAKLGHGIGTVKRLAPKISELKVDFGTGYRVYFTRRGPTIVILLAGGDKTMQQKDIIVAMKREKEV